MEKFICKDCGHAAKPKRYAKGSFVIELFLWLFFIIPGIFYSMWRMCNKYNVCKLCGSESVIPVSSPQGKKLVSESNHIEEAA